MKNLIVLGGGESGVGAAILGAKNGFDVFLSDICTIKPIYKKKLQDYNIEFEEGVHTIEKVLEADLVVKSPGIPTDTPLIKQLGERKIEIISEIEFGSRYTEAKIIAITGSNGKTTTASLVYHLFKNAGLKVALAGNIGKSFALLIAEKEYDYYILEVSSFQLDDIASFKPDVAVLLNISPDHLDRYDDQLSNYAESKFRITENQIPSDYFIYNNDDLEIKKMLKNIGSEAKLIPFSTESKQINGAYSDKEYIYFNYPNTFDMTIKELSLIGSHNVANSMAAATTANIMHLKKESIRQSLSSFDAIEHRLESVGSVDEIEFINDSKATI
jgi:UDP-N-acetylmuramoylalanine--D-glutamate ligase